MINLRLSTTHYLYSRTRYTGKLLASRMQLVYATLNHSIPPAYPDFMCIGAPRTGTTWLHSTLQRHPDIFMPKRKELHFFDEPIYREIDGNTVNINSSSYNIYYNPEKAAHWRWYSLHYKNAGKRLKGEITPAYSRLSDNRVRLISEKLGDLKIIYMMRNPIERVWSGVRNFSWRTNRKRIASMSDREILDFSLLPRRLIGGDYMTVIEKWEKYFSPDRFLYLFYEDLHEAPRKQIEKVCNFLEVDASGLVESSRTEKKVNTSIDHADMPAQVFDALVEYYSPGIKQLEEKFGRDLNSWLQPPHYST